MMLDSELRGLCRTAIERFTSEIMDTRVGYRKVRFQLATRVVAGIVAVLIFPYIKRIPHINTLVPLVSFVLIGWDVSRPAS